MLGQLNHLLDEMVGSEGCVLELVIQSCPHLDEVISSWSLQRGSLRRSKTTLSCGAGREDFTVHHYIARSRFYSRAAYATRVHALSEWVRCGQKYRSSKQTKVTVVV